MKDSSKILIGITLFASALGLFLFLSGKKVKKEMNMRLDMIADEGYETAGDILFPQKYKLRDFRPSMN